MVQQDGAAGEPAWEKRDSRGYGMVDKQTGEVVDAIPILVPRRHKLGTGFFMGIQESFVDLARKSKKDKRSKQDTKDESSETSDGEEGKKDKKRRKHPNELSADSWRILFFLLGRMEYENHLRVGQSEIVRELEMHKSSVSRALKQLADLGILVPTGQGAGRSSFYKLDSQLAWRGKARNRPKPPPKPRKPDEERNAEAPAPAAQARPAAETPES